MMKCRVPTTTGMNCELFLLFAFDFLFGYCGIRGLVNIAFTILRDILCL
jgi:hypothetical protein